MGPSDKPSFAVVGAGAVGGYFGGRLAEAGFSVTFIARGSTLDVLRADGLRVESIKGDFRVRPQAAAIGQPPESFVDVLLVAVKAWQVADVAEALVPWVGPDTLVVPLQNGVEAHDVLAAALGEGSVAGGLCRILSESTGPGHVRHFGSEPNIIVGAWNGEETARIGRLVDGLRAAGISAKASPKIQVKVWEKFLFIASISGVGAVTRMPIGVLRAQAETRAMIVEAMEEVVRVGRDLGVAIPEDAVTRTMAFVDGLPAEATASMQRDLMEGRPSELDAQNGAVVRLGARRGVAVPLNTFIYHALLPMERRARGERAGSNALHTG